MNHQPDDPTNSIRGSGGERFTKQPDDPGTDDNDAVADATARKILWGIVFSVFIIIGSILYACFPAKAQHLHNAADPKHWYDSACCALNDCAPIAAEMISETPAGYLATIKPGSHPSWRWPRTTNLVLLYAYRDPKIRPSQDGEWHVCLTRGGLPLCLYVIGGGF